MCVGGRRSRWRWLVRGLQWVTVTPALAMVRRSKVPLYGPQRLHCHCDGQNTIDEWAAVWTWVALGSILKIRGKEMVPDGTRLVPFRTDHVSVSDRTLEYSGGTRQPADRSDRSRGFARADDHHFPIV